MSQSIMRGVPRRKRIGFAIVTVLVGAGIPLLMLGLGDVYLHHKYEKGVLVNVWGYRGPTVGRKRSDEFRIAVLGGSSAFGYGVRWEESMPAVLEQKLTRTKRRYTVVNLAYNNEGAYSFLFTLKDFAYLHYDLVCLYEGYNDLMGDPAGPNLSVFRRDSPIFRLTGYLPIFPLIFREKASVLRYGDTRELYRGVNHTVFTPPSARMRAVGGALRTAADVGESLERQLGKLSSDPVRRINEATSSGCKYPWAEYCKSINDAVVWARQQHKRVLVVTQPYAVGVQLRERHIDQQRALATMLRTRFGADPGVVYLDLGPAIDLNDSALSFDRMHLTAAGNERLANALVEPIRQMASQP